jgi:protein-S-isoprenylcysteine O-methyltransferase Ste14
LGNGDEENSAWIIFFVPGIMLLLNTWIGLSASLVMYLLVRILAENEEIYLESVFGEEYLAYKKRIPAVLPVGWFVSKE